MHQATLQSVMDFSAGSCFTMMLLATVMLLLRKKASRLHLVSGVLFVYVTLMNMVLFVLFYLYGCRDVPVLHAVNLYQATVMPFAACVLYELTHPNMVRMPHILAHVVPFMMMLGVFLVTGASCVYRVAMWLSFFYGIGVIAHSVYSVNIYRRRLRQWSSYMEGLDLRWLGRIVWAFLGVLVVWGLASVFSPQWVAVLYNFSIGILFLALASCLVRQDVPDWATVMLGKDEDEAGDAVPVSSYSFASDFTKAFEQDRVYLDNHLTITKLAEALGTNRTYLSSYINNELHSSFFEYVNRLRVEHAKRLLVEVNDPLDVVAVLSGFNSLSSFRRAFSSLEGMTPGQYRIQYGKG